MKRLKVSLLAKVVIAIAAGVVFGQFLPGGIARIFVTFNSLFGNFLSFSIPLIILGLVTPAIGELGKGAGRLLALTALIAYGSTIFSGFFTYFSSSAIFPHILPVNAELTAMENPEDFMLQPYFTVAMPAVIVVPERERPGTTATHWHRPIISASSTVILRSVFLPGVILSDT